MILLAVGWMANVYTVVAEILDTPLPTPLNLQNSFAQWCFRLWYNTRAWYSGGVEGSITVSVGSPCTEACE